MQAQKRNYQQGKMVLTQEKHICLLQHEVQSLEEMLNEAQSVPRALKGKQDCMLRVLDSLGSFKHFQALLAQHPSREDPATATHGVRGWPPVGEKIQVLRAVKYWDDGKHKTKQVQPRPFC
jgi:hypothetical protein